MTLKLPVPRISITSDGEDEEDRNCASFQDALTDYEDLDNEDEQNAHTHNNNYKLNFDAKKLDSYLTDVEDVEGSDIEDDNKIVKHTKPVNSKIFNINPGVLEETYKIKSKKSRERKKLKNQTTVMRSSQSLNRPALDDEAGVTDLEDVLASDEDMLNDDIPDTYFPSSMLEEIEGTSISDGINHFKTNANLDEDISIRSVEKRNLNIPISKKDNLTDVEIVSDAETDVAVKRNKRVRRRRPKGTLRNQGAVTDIEDIDMSAEEAKMYTSLGSMPSLLVTTNVNKKANLFYQSQSFLYDSDNEEDDPSILKKEKKKISNLVVDDVYEGLTDFDDVNMTDSDEDYKYNASAMEAELKKLSDAYGAVHDVASKVDNDSSLSDNENYLSENEDSNFNISFKKMDTQNIKYLVLPNQLPSVLTDVESICSSDEEKVKKLPLAIVEKVIHDYITDEEAFSDDEEVQYFIDYKSLPKVFRKMILIKENKSGEPIVNVMPLDDYCKQSLVDAKNDLNSLTDVENMSDSDNEEEFLNVDNPVRGPTPDLVFIEQTCINESERTMGSLVVSKAVNNISDCKTDIEEIFVDNKKRIKKYTKKQSKLEVNTDCEDLSDCSVEKLPVQRQAIDVTDTENMEFSENDFENYQIPIGSQNYVLDMEEESVISKEGYDSISKNTTLLNVNVIKCSNRVNTPIVTDTEDIAVSAEEDNYEYKYKDNSDCFEKLLNENSCTNVSCKSTKKISLNAPEERIYLKGSLDSHTDIEDIESADSVIEADESIKVDKNISIDWKNNFVVFGSRNEEWEAPKEETEEVLNLQQSNQTQDNLDGDARMAGEVTYESVLLTNLNRNISLIPPIQQFEIKSYSEVDLMLDKMLIGIDEAFPSPNLESCEKCVNTLDLVPTTDAIIEVPIKKTKSYQSTLDMDIEEFKNLDLVCFENYNEELENADEDYDLVAFDYQNRNTFSPDIQTNPFENFVFSSQSELPPTETISNISKFFLNDDQNFHDYETIDSSYKRDNDIWWEGTYRNLSIVPEEDEENLSSISKAILEKSLTNTENNSTTSDNDTSSNSSDEVQDNVIKAEVKLLVKTNIEGKEQVEVCSVKEILENQSKSKDFPNIQPQSTSKSNTYFLDSSKYSKSDKPVFTLQRLFVRTPIEPTNNNPSTSNSKLELIAEPISNYPLKCDLEKNKFNEHFPDLYVNSPFYPCYDLPTPNYLVPQQNSPIEFVEYTHDFNPPKAYCDWIAQMDTEKYKGLTSPTAKVKPEDSLDIVKADVDILETEKIENTASKTKPQLKTKDKTKEPLFKPKTKTETMQNDIVIDDKKEKKGIINTLKSFVSKSFDQSDSESDRSQAKDAKEKKKQKKSKSKGQIKTNENGATKKPRLPTPPLTEPEHFKDLPFVEVSPNADDNKVFPINEVKYNENKEQSFLSKANIEVKDFTMDVQKSINDIENEILPRKVDQNKSIMNMYDNETKPLIASKNFLIEDDPSADIKLATHNLIQNEIMFQGWTDDKHNVMHNQPPEKTKPKSKPIKLFGFLSGKLSKDVSDEEKSENQASIIEKQDKEESKEVTEAKTTGPLNVFSKISKKHSDRTPKEHHQVSDDLKITLKNTNDFIKTEIEKYDDLKLIKNVEVVEATKKPETEEQPVKKREKREKSKEPEKRRSGILNYIFGKDENKEVEANEDITKTSSPNIVTEPSTYTEDKEVVINVKDTKEFLMNELENYQGGKEIATSTKIIEEPVKSKKGVFNIFTKKEKTIDKDVDLNDKQTKNNINEQQAKKKTKSPMVFIKKEKTKIQLPENVLKDINECNNFLQLEVDNYFDQKSIGMEKVEKEETPPKLIPTDSPKKETRKGLFNIFSKKDKKSIDGTDDQNLIKQDDKNLIESTRNEPDADKNSLKDFLNSDNLTRLPENILKDMSECNDFLKLEVDNYFDQKLIKIEKAEEKETPPKHISTDSPKKESRKGIFNIFTKKDKKSVDGTEDQNLVKQDDKNLIENTIIVEETKYSLNTSTQTKLPESVLKDMNESNDFLKLEVNNYFDQKMMKVEKIKKDETPLKPISIDSPKKESRKGIFNIFSKRDKKSVDGTDDENLIKQDDKNLIESPINEANFDEDTRISVRDFLNTETVNYDCPAKDLKKKGEFTEEQSASILKPLSNGIDVISSTKQIKEDSFKPIVEEIKIKTSTSTFFKDNQEDSKLDLGNDTQDFLKMEVLNYHDVKSNVNANPGPQETKEKFIFYKPSDKSQGKKESSKKHKTKRDPSDSTDESDSQMKSPKFSLFRKKDKVPPVTDSAQTVIEKPLPIPEICLKEIIDTKDFLKNEQLNYSDSSIKYETTMKSPDTKIKDVALSTLPKSPDMKSSSKIKTSKKQISSESGEESDSCTKSTKFKLFSKVKNKKPTKTMDQQLKPENLIETSDSLPFPKKESDEQGDVASMEIIDKTKSFLQTEVTNHQDVKTFLQENLSPQLNAFDSKMCPDENKDKEEQLLIKQKPTTESSGSSKGKRKSSSKFKKTDSSESGEESDGSKKSSRYKLFTRKKKADKDKVIIKEASSKEILDDGIDSKNSTKEFLTEEVIRYEDVRLVYPPIVEITEPIENIEDKKTKFNIINKLIKKTKKEDHENIVELPEETLLTMKHTNDFLNNEIAHFNDVQFKKISTDDTCKVLETTPNSYDQNMKTSQPDDVLVSLKDTHDFLSNEVNNYEDSSHSSKENTEKPKSNKTDGVKKEVTFRTEQPHTLKDILTPVDLKSSSDNSEISQKTILVKTIVFNSAQEVIDSSSDVEKPDNDIETTKESTVEEIPEDLNKDTSTGKKKKGIFNKIFGKDKNKSADVSFIPEGDSSEPGDMTEKSVGKKSKGFLSKINEKLDSVERKVESVMDSVTKKSKEEQKEDKPTSESGNVEGVNGGLEVILHPSATLENETLKMTNTFLEAEKTNATDTILYKEPLAKEVENENEKSIVAGKEDVENELMDKSKIENSNKNIKMEKKKKKQGIFDKIFSSSKSKSKDKPDVVPDNETYNEQLTKVPNNKTIEKVEVLSPIKDSSLGEIENNIAIIDSNINEASEKLQDKLLSKEKNTSEELKDPTFKLETTIMEKESVEDDFIKDTVGESIKEAKYKLESGLEKEIDEAKLSTSTIMTDTKFYIENDIGKLVTVTENIDHTRETITATLTTEFEVQLPEGSEEIFSTIVSSTENTREVRRNLQTDSQKKVIKADEFLKSQFKDILTASEDNIKKTKSTFESDLDKAEDLVSSKVMEAKDNVKTETDKLTSAGKSAKDTLIDVTTKVKSDIQNLDDSFKTQAKDIKDNLEETSNKISSTTSSSVNKVNEVKASAEQELNQIAKSADSALTSKLEDVKGKIKDDFAKLTEGKQDLKEQVKDTTEKSESKLLEAKGFISKNLKDLGDNIKDTSDNTISAISASKNAAMDTKSTLELGLKNELDKAQDLVSSKLMEAKDNVKTETDKLTSAGESVKDTLKDITTTVKADIQNLDDSLKIQTKDIKDNLEDASSKISSTATSSVDKFNEVKANAKQEVKQTVKSADSALTSKLEDAKGKIKDDYAKLTEAKQDLKEQVKDTTKKSESKLLEAKGFISKNLKDLGDNIKDTSDKTISAISASKDAAMDTKSTLESGLKNELDKAQDLVSSKVMEAKDNVKTETDKLTSAGESVKDTLKDITTTVKADIQNLDDSLKTQARDIKDNLEDASSKISSTATSSVDKFNEVKANAKQEVKQTVKSADSALTSKLEDAKGKIKDDYAKLTEAKQDLKEQVKDTTKKSESKLLEAKGFISKNLKDLGDNIKDTSDKTISAISASKDTLIDTGSTLKSDVQYGLDKAQDLVSSKVMDAKDNVKTETDKLISAGESAKDTLKDITTIKKDIQNLDDSVKTKATEIKTKLDGTTSKISSIASSSVDKVNKIKVNAEQDGKQIVKSADSALTSKLEDVNAKIKDDYAKLREAKQDLKEQVKDTTEKSESKLLEAKGFISKNLKDLGDNIKDTSDKTISAISASKDAAMDTKSTLESSLKNDLDKAQDLVSSKVMEAKDNIKTETDKLTSTGKSAKDTLTDIKTIVKTDIQNLDNSFKTQAKDIDAKLEDTSSKISSVASSTVDKLNEVKTTAGKEIKQKAESLECTLSTKLDDMKDKIRDDCTKLEDVKQDLKEHVTDTTKKSKSKLLEAEGIKDLGDDAKDASDKSISAIISSKDCIKETKSTLEAGLKNELDKAHDSVLSKITEVKDNIKSETDNFTTAGKNATDKLEHVTSALKSDIQNLEGSLKTQAKDFEARLEDTSDKVHSVTSTSLDKVNEVETTAEKGIKQKFENAESALTKNLKDVKDKIEEDCDKFEDFIQEIKEQVTETTNDFENNIQTATRPMSAILKDFGDNIKKTSDKTISALTGSKDTIRKTKSTLESDIKIKLDKANVLIDTESDKLISVKKTTVDKMEDVTSSVKTDIQKIEDSLETRIKDFGATLEDVSSKQPTISSSSIGKVKQLKTNTVTDIRQKITSAENTFAEMFKDPKEIGKEQYSKLVDVKEEVKDSAIKLGSKPEDSLLLMQKIAGENIKDGSDKIISTKESITDQIQKTDFGIIKTKDTLVKTKSNLEDECKSFTASLKLKDEIDKSVQITDENIIKHSPIFRIESEEEVLDSSVDNLISTDLDTSVSGSNKITDIDPILDINEQVLDPKVEKIEKKLKRVEKKFERLASQSLEQEDSMAKELNITSPEIEIKRDSEFQKVISQLSTEEVADLQSEYSTLWDEQTFSHTDEWGSKTPDSQAEVTDLPQGEIVYMAPVTLNKNNLVNKAGIEVEVIPRMRSPYASPKPKRKKHKKRAKSELGYYENSSNIEDGGSLPDLNNYIKSSIMNAIMSSPQRFLQAEINRISPSCKSESNICSSIESSESLSKGQIMSAVVDWLNKSKSEELLINSSTSIADDLFYNNANDPSRLQISESNLTDINLTQTDDQLSLYINIPKISSVSLTHSTDKTLPQPIPRSSKVINQLEQLSPIETQISLETSTSNADNDSLITEIDSYSDRKKFWEKVSKDNDTDSKVHKKIISHEITCSESIIATNQTNEQEVLVQPPVPKPRTVHANLETLIGDNDENKPLSEYQHSFKNPQEIASQEEKRQHVIESKESIDSDNENSCQFNISSGYENTGYISDSGDVEQYISDSEIEDRVPQIRERQMSVFQVPTPSIRKSIYERSCSLPTEDLYEVSAQSILLRKQMFEEQIKKDMVDDVLMTEIEEEPSPEHKTLNLPNVVEEDEPSGVKSVPEPAVGLVSVLPTIGKLNNKIAEMEKAEALILDEDYDFDNNFSTTDLENEKYKVQDTFRIINDTKEFEHKTNEQLIIHEENADFEEDFPKKSEVSTTLEESSEIHVDKSEIEASEKKLEKQIPKDITKTTDQSEIRHGTDEIPEITFSLSGIQKRISEESDTVEEKELETDFQITKRSEAGSPINHPEEHIQETVWEVSIESQPQTYEEVITDIQVHSHGVVEKDEDFSGSVRDESDLGSEIHQDHSESYESDHRSDSQADIEKLILESLHYQKISPEEAKLIASELVADIEAEIHQRNTFGPQDPPAPEYAKNQVSDYLRQLAETKGLDSREVQLVQSVLARKQRELTKLSRGDTQASSIEITDEDLRYSGTEISPSCSLSNILEEQIDKLEEEKIRDSILDAEEILKTETEFSTDNTISTKTNTISNRIEDFKTERIIRENENIIFEEDETVVQNYSEENVDYHNFAKDVTTSNIKSISVNKQEEFSMGTQDTIKEETSLECSDDLITVVKEDEIKVKDTTKTAEQSLTDIKNVTNLEMSSKEVLDDKIIETETTEVSQLHTIQNENISRTTEIVDITVTKNGNEKRDLLQTESTRDHKEKLIIEDSHKETTVTSTEIISEIKPNELENILESKQETTIVHQILSDDSKSSEESFKSPDDFMSTSSSKKEDDESKIQKDEVVFRKVKQLKDDSSSTSSNLKPDRKSGIDFEAYSSSGESHYQSFEIDSNKSRPCSSEIDVVIAAGSSDYESAVTSQELSAPLHLTSTEYHTAVSSISSKGSLKSLDSESSGNLASVEVSEASETLVPSEFEFCADDAEQSKMSSSIDVIIQRQNTDLSESEIPFDTQRSIDLEEDFSNNIDIPSKMKRSQEMTFQPEPKSLVPDSPHYDHGDVIDIEDRLGASVEDGSILSMSLSSTSSLNAQKTVIELSHTDSEKLDAGMSASNLSEQLSFEESDLIGSRENISVTPTLITTSEMSTSTQMLPQSAHVNNVTLTTSVVSENGVQSAGTQVITQTYNTSEFSEQRKRGHRRTESTTFVPTKFTAISSLTEIEKKIQSDLAESDKYTHSLSLKQSDSFDKKDFSGEYYETEADQGLHRDISEGKYAKSDDIESERQDHSEASYSPKSDNVCIIESKSLSCDESNKVIQDITKKALKDILDKRDSHGKSSSTSSEKSSFEEAEAEAAFNMVAHTSPAHKIKQICPIMEDEDAEKHELETRERAQKDLERRIAQLRDQSPGAIPDIKVTQHMTPMDRKGFHYPDLELEEKETDIIKSTPETPASNSSKSSESTDQGHEYVIDESETSIPEESESHIQDDKTVSKSEIISVIEKTVQYETDKETVSPTESPNSDSFEILEKPDLMDEFVVIEEVAKEAHETDMEGKSLIISKKKGSKKHDEEVEHLLVRSAPSPSTKMTDIKYYPDGSSSDELGFEFEDSPPNQKNSKGSTSPRDYVYEYDKELEANKKWIEQQFQGDHAAMIAAGYGYEMDFERCPLEDIKEEDGNDFDSRIGSLNSQKDLGGSLGSIKDSYSSTPEYDVLAGRRYFTKSGEHDDISMSSLQEFENLERAMSLETRKFHQGSQDSSSNGSFKTRYFGRSGQGDDISVSSLKEFEGLEKACIAAHKVEVKAKEEEMLLTQIDEAAESMTSESESCETITSVDKKVVPESDEEDYEKRMFEIDEIIRQAQTNVERFIDLKDGERTESIGRGDSVEEVSKIPDLELDAPLHAGAKVKWNEKDDIMQASIDSLDTKEKPSHHGSADSLDLKTAGDIMTASTDSIEFQAQKSKSAMAPDSLDFREQGYTMTSSDSLELPTGSNVAAFSDSIDEDGSRLYCYDQSSSSTGKDLSAKEDEYFGDNNKVLCDLLESTDSIASTSAATHATYQYETDSVFSGSFTSGGSNTMVSSTDNIDTTLKESVSIADAVRKVWFEDEHYLDENQPYVTEIIEPGESEITRYTFTGPDVDQKLKQFIDHFNEGETVHEERTVDSDGNIHVKKTIQKRVIVKDNIEKIIGGDGLSMSSVREFIEGDQSLLTSKAGECSGETSSSGTNQAKEKYSGSQAEAEESNLEFTSRSATTDETDSLQLGKSKEENDKK